MDVADPPDLPLSPMKAGTSMEEMHGSESVTKSGRDFLGSTTPTKVSEVKVVDKLQSGDLSPEVLNQKSKSDAEVLIKPKGSWVGAVKGQKVLKKFEVEIEMKDEIGSITVPEEITKDVAPLWDDFLIGKFLDEAPHIAKVHSIVNKIWNLNDKDQKI